MRYVREAIQLPNTLEKKTCICICSVKIYYFYHFTTHHFRSQGNFFPVSSELSLYSVSQSLTREAFLSSSNK